MLFQVSLGQRRKFLATVTRNRRYETVADPIIDWMEGRDDLDAGRVGIYGVILGGYHAPRAASFEDRIKACVSVSGAYEWGANWDKKSLLNREVFRIRSHCATMEEAREKSKALSLRGIAKNITCPIYIVAGGLDQLTAVEAAEQIAAERYRDRNCYPSLRAGFMSAITILTIFGHGHSTGWRKYKEKGNG